jgi:glycosyltransferase involved in cell wall biosynthesis
MRVDQLIPTFHRGDAIGDTAFHIKQFLQKNGFQSEIYCLERDEGLESQSRLFSDFPRPQPSDVTIFHFALPSPLTEKFSQLPSRKILIYHNITPEHFFQPYSSEMAHIARVGREEVKMMATRVDMALADSEYNRQELEELGYPRTEVFPLFIDFQKYERPPDRFFQELFQDGRVNLLFVGRIVPNKCLDDLIRIVFYYKKYISPLVRLIIVGKTTSLPPYYKSLVKLVDDFYLRPEEVVFTGHVTDEQMYALYRTADVFLSMSEHEGFGLPLVESMIFDLPVVAYEAAAVPYTLGGAGILLRTKRVDLVAELIELIIHREEIKRKIIGGQRARLEQLRSEGLEDKLLQVIKELGES